MIEAFGRPTWRERRRRSEAAELAVTSVPLVRGDGQPVVLATGFGGSPESVATLTDWLDEHRWVTTVAPLGRNAASSAWAAEQLIDTLERTGPAVLIGHSRGGQQCRIVAQTRPDLVKQLITLGAPVRSHVPRHFALRATVELLRLAGRTGLHPRYDHQAEVAYEQRLSSAFGVDVPWVTIFSRSDGFVAPQACQDIAAQPIEIDASHRGLIESIAAFGAIADALDPAHTRRL